MKRITTTLAMLLLVVVFAVPGVWAQHVDHATVKDISTPSGIGVKPAVSPLSLLDASRITWSHSYSVAFFSGGSYSGSAGLLQTTMMYDISDNLKLSLNLGMTHNPGALFNSGQEHNASFLPGVQLDWRPSENVFMSLSVQTYNGYTSPYAPYYYGTRYSRPGSVWFLE